MLEIALAAGVSPETLRKIETGRVATPAFPTVAVMAAVLGLSLDDVWVEISAPERDREAARSVTTLASGQPRRRALRWALRRQRFARLEEPRSALTVGQRTRGCARDAGPRPGPPGGLLHIAAAQGRAHRRRVLKRLAAGEHGAQGRGKGDAARGECVASSWTVASAR